MEQQVRERERSRTQAGVSVRGLAQKHFRRVGNLRLLLLLLLAGAFLVRYYSAGYGLPYLYDWDEPEIMQSSMQILRHEAYGPARSGRIGYGILNNLMHAGWGVVSFFRGIPKDHFPGGIWGLETERDTGYYWTIGNLFMWHQARILSALLGCVAVAFLFRAASLLGGGIVGIGAAAVMAFGSTQVISTSRITPDAPALAALCVCFYASTVVLKERSLWAYLTAAAAAAVASGFKLNYVVAIVLPLAAHLIGSLRSGGRILSGPAVAMVLLFGGLAVTFQIHAVLYPTLFLHNYGTEAKAHVPPVGSSGGLIKYGKKFLVLLDAGKLYGAAGFGKELSFSMRMAGIPLVLTVLVGIWFMLRKARVELLFVFLYLAAAMAMVGSTLAFFFPRHLLPAVPAAAVLAGYGLLGLHELMAKVTAIQSRTSLSRFAFPVIGTAAFLPVALSTFYRVGTEHAFVDPRTRLSKEMLSSLPAGSSILLLEEARWYQSPEEKKRFKLRKATIPQVLSGYPGGRIDYVVAPSAVRSELSSPAAQQMEKIMNEWLKAQKPRLSFGGRPSHMEAPPAEIGVQLIPIEGLTTQSAVALPSGLVWGTALSPVGGGRGVSLGAGPLFVHSGQAAEAPLFMERPGQRILVRARGTAPIRQETQPTLSVVAQPIPAAAGGKPAGNVSVSLTRSQSGMGTYEVPFPLPPGKYRIRVVPSDPDDRGVLVESIEFK